MASAVDIVNTALAHIGDAATVSSISPAEGSAQARHGARFYPIARDELLAMHNWTFATKRATLAALDVTEPSSWTYAYAEPADLLKVIAVLDSDAQDDLVVTPSTSDVFAVAGGGYASVNPNAATSFTPRPYVREVMVIDGDDVGVIFSDTEDAELRYVAKVTDTTKFPPLFVSTLGYLLASYLAGPVIKGMEGVKVAAAMRQTAVLIGGRAMMQDANQQRRPRVQPYPWSR